MVDEGDLRKVEVPDGPNRFDFSLKIITMSDVQNAVKILMWILDEIPDLLEKIHNTHGTDFLDYDISFKGICRNARKKIKDENLLSIFANDGMDFYITEGKM